SGQFCKKIRGKIFYFGKVDNPDAALKRYHEHCRDLHSGKATRVERTDEITVAELANRFLAAKDRKREIGDIEAATFVEYHRDWVFRAIDHAAQPGRVPGFFVPRG
ncbi:MAG: hypothetical protein NTY25_05305, partial [Planctomycetia bacterium]|nr:hypothetical protein [Planctomycetia bacterium]